MCVEWEKGGVVRGGEGRKGSSEGEGCSEMAIRFWGFFPVSVLAGGLAG